MRCVAALVALVVVAGCGGDEPARVVGEEAVVRVHSAEPRPAIASICIGTTCNSFPEREDARSAEFALVIDELTPVEVLLIGDERGSSTRTDIRPGGCITVSYSETGVVVGGCDDDV